MSVSDVAVSCPLEECSVHPVACFVDLAFHCAVSGNDATDDFVFYHIVNNLAVNRDKFCLSNMLNDTFLFLDVFNGVGAVAMSLRNHYVAFWNVCKEFEGSRDFEKYR